MFIEDPVKGVRKAAIAATSKATFLLISLPVSRLIKLSHPLQDLSLIFV
ncbi:MAG: hypothetical protein AB1426_10005 [Bacillota bacterium]